MKKDKGLEFEEKERHHFTPEEAEALIENLGLVPISGSVVVYIEPRVEKEGESLLEMEELENQHKEDKKYLKVLAAADNCVKVKKGDYVIPKFQFTDTGVFLPPTKPLMVGDCFYHVLDEVQILATVKNPLS